MPKEKSINPAQAQRKAEKAKAIKKGKSFPPSTLSIDLSNLYLQAKQKLPLAVQRSSPVAIRPDSKDNLTI